jgi:hypothetical protein
MMGYPGNMIYNVFPIIPWYVMNDIIWQIPCQWMAITRAEMLGF